MATGTPLKVWFVNVGHGDCTIVKFPSGRVMMVDICNSKVLDDESKSELLEAAGLADPLARALYVKFGIGAIQAAVLLGMRSFEDLLDDPIDDVLKVDPELADRTIFRYVQTHPDMDHMTGLYRLFQREPSIDIVNFWDTDNTKDAPQKTGEGYDDRDWDEYERIRAQSSDPKVLRLYRGASGDYYADDSIAILSPTKSLKDDCNESEDWNNLSQVLRITHGKSSLILPGDVEATGFVACGANALYPGLDAIEPRSAVACFISAGLFAVWLIQLNDKWVEDAAFDYATRLLAACDGIAAARPVAPA